MLHRSSKFNKKREKNIYYHTRTILLYSRKKSNGNLDQKAVLNAEVITLSRMAYRVINEVGGTIKTNLTKPGKAMIIASILENNKKNLKFLGKQKKTLN